MERDIHFAKTKIIGTIGPATGSIETLVKLIEAGMDVARLNMSHGTHEIHAETIENIRRASVQTGIPLSILLDLCGPKIRLGEVKEEFTLRKGDVFTITTDDVIGTRERVSTSYKQLPGDIQKGDSILINDGLIRLRVEEAREKEVICTTVYGGVISSKKGMNLPNVDISISSITEKDRKDLEFGIKYGVDFIALSFVRSQNDIKELRRLLEEHGASIPIVAKIEKPEAIQNIDGIILETDIVMVARGDLGVEMETEEVPILQKMIIEKCNDYNKPVITATQMLESMVTQAKPTRAEASDVANAVFDGTDAVMLSAETSVGKYPLESVSIMNTIVIKAEERPDPRKHIHLRRKKGFLSHADHICRAACIIAEDASASAIIVITKTGRTAQMLSRFRPHIPVIAFTESEQVIRKLKIIWGVRGELIDRVGETDITLNKAREAVLSLGYVHRGDTVVYVTGIPLIESSQANMIKLEDL